MILKGSRLELDPMSIRVTRGAWQPMGGYGDKVTQILNLQLHQK